MLVKSILMKEGEGVDVIFDDDKKTFAYKIPEGYKGVLHFVVDLYPAKQSVIFVPGSGHPKL